MHSLDFVRYKHFTIFMGLPRLPALCIVRFVFDFIKSSFFIPYFLSHLPACLPSSFLMYCIKTYRICKAGVLFFLSFFFFFCPGFNSSTNKRKKKLGAGAVISGFVSIMEGLRNRDGWMDGWESPPPPPFPPRDDPQNSTNYN